MLAGIFHELPECPYAGTALRSEARRMLDRLEYLHPGTLERVVRGQEEVAALRGRAAGRGTRPLFL
jgi:hypothetical protein